MYSRQQSVLLKKEFWTTLGQYLSPLPSADSEKINWINYKTGEKNILFKMHADNKHASISIDLTHKDADIRDIYYQQFLQFQNIFHTIVGEEWHWHSNTFNEHGLEISRIYKDIDNVNIYNKADWPTIISFFKPRIIALDEFWSQVKYSFEALG